MNSYTRLGSNHDGEFNRRYSLMSASVDSWFYVFNGAEQRFSPCCVWTACLVV